MTANGDDAWLTTFLSSDIPGKTVCRLHTNDQLFVKGSPMTELFLVISGRFRINATGPDGRIAVHNFLGPKSWLGLRALSGRRLFVHTAVATETSEVAAFALPMFDGLRKEYPNLNDLLLQGMASQYATHVDAVDDHFFRSAEWRLANMLLEMFPADETVTELEIEMSMPKMAELIGSSHMTAKRFVTTSEQARRITRKGRTLIVHRVPMREFLLSESHDHDVHDDASPPLPVGRKLAK